MGQVQRGREFEGESWPIAARLQARPFLVMAAATSGEVGKCKYLLLQ